MKLHVFVLGITAVAVSFSAYGQPTTEPLPPDIHRALGCLVTASYVKDNLTSIGLRIGSEATVRYGFGSVSGMMKTPNTRWIAVYSKRGDRAWLLIADPDGKGGYAAVRNGYRLTKHASRWSADEGNGGLAAYAAVSLPVDLLNRSLYNCGPESIAPAISPAYTSTKAGRRAAKSVFTWR